MAPSNAPSVADANAYRLGRRVRNDRFMDIWSAAHVLWALVLAMLLGPIWSFVLMVIWEPFEIFLLGPRLARWGIPFGHETWRNSVSDIGFDALGAIAGFLVLLAWDPLGVL